MICLWEYGNMAYVKLNKFKYWCYKVLPLVYDNSLSYYEVLCKVVDYINQIIENQQAFAEDLEELSVDVAGIHDDIDAMQADIDAIKNGEYIDQYIELVKEWVDTHLPDIVGRVARYIIFGLSNDGYFVAYIPESWQFMEFDSIADPTSELYGHLVMRW